MFKLPASDKANDLIVINGEIKAIITDLNNSRLTDFADLADILEAWQTGSAASSAYRATTTQLNDVEAIAGRLKTFADKYPLTARNIAVIHLINKSADSLLSACTAMRNNNMTNFSNHMKTSVRYFSNLAKLVRFRGNKTNG